jgi:basic membrane lipoprotein Med (substrate-binding protein (PBP1-ABC) superfamily)/DNA-binding SARP family transcriptional activator
VQFEILGPLRARVEGEPVELGSPKERALLGVLLLHRNDVVATETLIDAIWGAAPPRTAAHSLQSYVSRLRGALGTDRILTRAPGYALVADDAELDAARFEQLVTTGRAALADGDPTTAASQLRDALVLWRGSPLADVAPTLHLAGETTWLAELHQHALEAWAASELALGRHEGVVRQLEELTTAFPLREPLWAHRMLALYRSGRGAEALRAYEELRDQLGEQLGADPSPALQRLHRRILRQDPTLDLPAGPDAGPPEARNPYKGLRPFDEQDAVDFHGRDELVRHLVEVLGEPGRQLVALIGPSGGGKSSVLRAGLVPALRRGAVEGSQTWTIVTFVPGAAPFDGLAAALRDLDPLRAVDDGAAWLQARAAGDGAEGQVLLAIDQLEELFTAAPAAVADRFLDALAATLEGGPDLRAVVTLRADLFDRPLEHRAFGRLLTSGVVVVLPLSPAELEAAVVRPSAAVGVMVDPELLAAIVADVAGRPGALPLLQYALTELFDRRLEGRLTLHAYAAIGGLDGALRRRADDLFLRSTPDEQEAIRQLFLRLVQPADRAEDTRRRVPMQEITALDVAAAPLRSALERYGRARLLTFDRDVTSGEPTIEMAHEALLRAWDRLAAWIEDVRSDLRRRAGLAAAVDEWREAGEDPDYLLVGGRLDTYAAWADATSLRLTTPERRFLDTSVGQQEALRAAEEARRAEAEAGRRRSSRRRWAWVAAAVGLTVAVPAAIRAASPPGDAPLVALVVGATDDGGFGQMMVRGMDRIERSLGVRTEIVPPLADVASEVRELCDAGGELIFLGGGEFADGLLAAEDCPDTTLVMIDGAGLPDDLPDNVVNVLFSTEEGSFLVGAAAAEQSRTRVVGFLGGQPWSHIEEFRAGFEAGVAAVAPDVDVVATFVTHVDDMSGAGDAYGNPGLGRVAAASLFDRGADVVYAVAGVSGDGALAEAAARSSTAEPRWVIGVDSDWYLTRPRELRSHVLTSMLKRLDDAIVDTTQAYLEGPIGGTERRYGLAEQGVDYTVSGGHVARYEPQLERLRDAIVAGEIDVPRQPAGRVVPAATETPSAAGTLRFTGTRCSYQGPTDLDTGQTIAVTVTNEASRAVWMGAYPTREAPPIGTDPVPLGDPGDQRPPAWVDTDGASGTDVAPGGTATVTVAAPPGTSELGCVDWSRALAYRAAALVTADADPA